MKSKYLDAFNEEINPELEETYKNLVGIRA